ncbi:MAG: endonuclease/exonuclease/phosphatase family protein [Myxococcota bacterium]|nr:endonuclease/exonuclease/phosphatase family protein [Myxococcota bacterium]MEE2780469.1 endonuclease/exonuclease/phosphatase family protein [Myxococcota bacterium]
MASSRQNIAVILLSALLTLGSGCASVATRAPEAPAERTPYEEQVVRVLSWNVGTSKTTDSSLDNDHIPIVVETIAMAGADVVLLQEVGSQHQSEKIRQGLADKDVHYTAVTIKTDPDVADRLLVTLFKGGQGEARSWHTSEGMGVLAVPAGGMWVLNVQGPPRFAPARNRFFREASTWAAEHTGPVIFGGDYNLDPDGKQFALWFTWPALDRSTFRLLRNAFPIGTTAKITTAQERAFDHIRARFARLVSEQHLTGHREGNMDHDPVMADIAPLMHRP